MSAAEPLGTLLVVGVGLIGASICRAARSRRLARRIVAVDHPRMLEVEAVRETVDVSVDAEAKETVLAHAASADLVVLAAPVSVIERQIAEVLEVSACVTDCGSTKRSIVRAAAGPGAARFVPGHPMAGDPRGGAAHSRADLFEGRTWILCPGEAAPSCLGLVTEFVDALGARPVQMSVEAHDRSVALTSHVPQLLASVLATLADERAVEGAAGPAFASATRVAGGSEAMWKDIMASNADEIAGALGEVMAQLAAVERGLAQRPPDLAPALELLARARERRRA
jgi:prephenate dehydrogenase